MRPKLKKSLTFLLRWGIAVVGIWLVIRQMSLYDRVWVISGNQLVAQRLAHEAPPDVRDGQSFLLQGNQTVTWDETAQKPEKKTVDIRTPAGLVTVPLIGVDLRGDVNRKPVLNRLYVLPNGPTAPGQWIPASQLAQVYEIHVPYPRVEVGLVHMARDADRLKLIASVSFFWITFVITSFRWHQLLLAMNIRLTLARTFVLNMVGAFYNTFMPGSTGGDVLKAYYASKQTEFRTRAVISVFVDRVIGLIALVILGGAMAAYQYFTSPPNDPAAHACGKITIISALIVLGSIVGCVVFYHPTLRRIFLLDWILSKFPPQKQKNILETAELYRQHKGLVLQSLLATFPVHITVVLSAMLAGQAFGLTLSPLYYFVAVPVIVLVGSIPISPQGAGVMEYFAILLTQRQGATVSQAFALCMSIRMVQIIWNLTGGFFVLRGGYHQPSAAEQRDLDSPDAGAIQPA